MLELCIPPLRPTPTQLATRGPRTAETTDGIRPPLHLRPPAHRLRADNLAPGKGRVIRRGARHHTVSRDNDGTLSALSARCTHPGCLVRFNDTEGT
ncbi:Rieske 2Fe-2S domain-containing protein [Streptomyces sp. NPDC059076]|uniref:Rieske 2Fe-2S domain-containing protein n=1 Tax=unclassified Streptomyces TaxID=2593676 RepID=UPI003678117B